MYSFSRFVCAFVLFLVLVERIEMLIAEKGPARALIHAFAENLEKNKTWDEEKEKEEKEEKRPR